LWPSIFYHERNMNETLDTTMTIELFNLLIYFEWYIWQRVSPGTEILRRLVWMVMIECISIYVIHFRIFGMDCWMLGEEFTFSVSVNFNIRNLKYFWISQMLLPQKLFCKTERKQFQKSMCSGDWWFVWNPRGRGSVCFYITFCYCRGYSGFMWEAAFALGGIYKTAYYKGPI